MSFKVDEAISFKIYPERERLLEPLLDLEPLPERLEELRERPDFFEFAELLLK